MNYQLIIPVIIVVIVLLCWLLYQRLTRTPFGKTKLRVALIFKFLDLVNSEKNRTVQKMRSGTDFNAKITQGKRRKMEKIIEVDIPVDGASIKARIYYPVNKDNLPLIVFYHGGGWVVCGLHTHDALCRYLAYKTGFAVMSVDYRLAPENKYPVAMNDSYAALKWAADNGHSMGFDTSRISVCGDSAGGNMAAVMSLKAKENAYPVLKCQALIYPAVDLAHTDTESYNNFSKGYGLTLSEMEYFREQYLHDESEWKNPDVSPLFAAGHSGLPPAIVITAGFDVLRDEGENYASVLKHAGVEVKLKRYEMMFHGFICTGGIFKEAWQASDEVAEFIVQKNK